MRCHIMQHCSIPDGHGSRMHTFRSLLWSITLKTLVWNILTPILFVLTGTWHQESFNLSKPVFFSCSFSFKREPQWLAEKYKTKARCFKDEWNSIAFEPHALPFTSVPAVPRRHGLLMFAPEQVCNKELVI